VRQPGCGRAATLEASGAKQIANELLELRRGRNRYARPALALNDGYGHATHVLTPLERPACEQNATRGSARVARRAALRLSEGRQPTLTLDQFAARAFWLPPTLTALSATAVWVTLTTTGLKKKREVSSRCGSSTSLSCSKSRSIRSLSSESLEHAQPGKVDACRGLVAAEVHAIHRDCDLGLHDDDRTEEGGRLEPLRQLCQRLPFEVFQIQAAPPELGESRRPHTKLWHGSLSSF